jgi:anti-sigma factor RsiW
VIRHRLARRHLPDLVDGTLPAGAADAVREHAAACARCERQLAELVLCDRLVAALPIGVAPFAAHAADRRLRRLASWAPPQPESRTRDGVEGLAMIAAAAALAGVVALAGVRHWLPAPGPAASGLIQVAYVMPASAPR